MFESLLTLLLALYLADFGSGLAHWFVDRYGCPKWPIVGPHFIALTQRHHDFPLEVFTLSVLRRNGGIWGLVILAAMIFWALGGLNPLTQTALFIGAMANFIHGWAHRSRRANGRLIAALQYTGVLQSRRHHARHHLNDKNSHFCIITDHINPVLEAVGFFPALERALSWMGLHPYWWQRQTRQPITI
ncbi:MAG: fatty acid desaturase CarF family protein [Pseudomonadota bacterium]